MSLNTVLLQQYAKQACQADAIVIGHMSSVAYHLSAHGTGVYGDYIFVIDTLLKDNAAASIRQQPHIVTTQFGGALPLTNGPVTIINSSFPLLVTGVTYLKFLRYIPISGAYWPIDALSTLRINGNKWSLSRQAFSELVAPGFTHGVLEYTIGNWLTMCP